MAPRCGLDTSWVTLGDGSPLSCNLSSLVCLMGIITLISRGNVCARSGEVDALFLPVGPSNDTSFSGLGASLGTGFLLLDP